MNLQPGVSGSQKSNDSKGLRHGPGSGSSDGREGAPGRGERASHSQGAQEERRPPGRSLPSRLEWRSRRREGDGDHAPGRREGGHGTRDYRKIQVGVHRHLTPRRGVPRSREEEGVGSGGR